MKKMGTRGRAIFRIAGVCAVLLTFCFTARASHIMGGDMSINQFDKGKFAFRVNVYTDCSSSSLRFSPFTIKSKCGNYNHSAGSGPYGGIDITPVCKKQCTPCSNSSCTFSYGIQELYFIDTIDVSTVNCAEFTVAWEQRGRSSKITTGANDQDFYIEGTFNKVYFREKSSIFFAHAPLLMEAKGICVTNTQNITAGADSISYTMADPLSGAGATIPYISGYSYDEPLKYDGYPDPDGIFAPPVCKGFHFNETTGELNFKSTQEDVTPIVIDATAWIKDSTGKYVKAATIRRDVALTIFEAPENRSPIITGFDCLKSNSIRVCAGDWLITDICTFDPDVDDTVSLSWDKGIPGASFTLPQGKTKWPKATLSWYADSTKISSRPYSFTVTVTDNTCPVPAVFTKRYYVYVDRKKTAFSYKKTDTCDRYTFKAIGDTTGAIFQWYVDGQLASTKPEFSYAFTKQGKHPVKFIATSGCEQVFFDTIEFTRPSVLTASRDEVPLGDTVTLRAGNGQLYTWWSGKDILKAKTAVITPKLTLPSQLFHVLATDTVTGCTWHDSITLKTYIRVWPGDADRNGVADYRDLLSIGVGIGTNGFRRSDTSTNWAPHNAYLWADRTYYANYADLDCNGDGNIWYNDTGALSRNYDPLRETVRAISSGSSSLQFKFLADTLAAGNDAIVEVYAKSDKADVLLNGIAFSYEYPDKYLKATPEFKWTGVFNKANYLKELELHKILTPGYAEAAVASEGKFPKSLNKPLLVAKVILHLKDSSQYKYSPKGEWVKLSFFNLLGADTFARPIGMKGFDDSVLVFNKIPPYEDVWPGDANHDGQANYKDLPGIGVGWGRTGLPRQDTSIGWYPHPAYFWKKTYFSADYKHLDCNGDGTIDARDTIAIGRNYDARPDSIRETSNTGAPFGFFSDADTLYAGDTVSMWVGAGTLTRPVKGVYGAAFSYLYTHKLIREGSLRFTWTKNNILQSSAKLHMYRDFGDGYAEGSLVRNDRKTIDGVDFVARIDFVVKDSTEYTYPKKGETLSFSFVSLTGIDTFGKPVPLMPVDHSIIIFKSREKDTVTSVRPVKVKGDIQIYPNPARQEVFVESGNAPIKEIVLTNMVGEVVIRSAVTGKKIRLETSHLRPGLYTLQVQTNNGIKMQKLIIR